MKLPWQCPDHPDAKIIESWDLTRYVYNEYPRGVGIKSNYKYECAECHRELAAAKGSGHV
jgi:hypothetical protein